MASRKEKNQTSGKESIPKSGDVTIESSAEDITANIETKLTTDHDNIADETKAKKSTSTPKKAGQQPPLTSGRKGLMSWLVGAALFLAFASAGLAGFSYMQINQIAAQQDDMLARLEVLDQRVAEMAEASLLKEQAEELDNFGIRLDDVTGEIGRVLEQIDAMGKTIADQLAEPGQEIINSLQKRLDEIDQSLSALNSNTETTASAKTDAAEDPKSETGQVQDQLSSTPPLAPSEEKAQENGNISENENSSSWMDWIKDFIRIERIDNGE